MSGNRRSRRGREGLAEECLQAAAGLQAAEPRPGFREAAYHRISVRLSEAGDGGGREARRSLSAHRRLRRAVLIPVSALALMLFFTVGAFAFSLDSAPDSALYSTKLFFERARLSLTGSSEAKVDYEVELVNKRLAELEDLVARGTARGGERWQSAYRDNVDRLYQHILALPEERRAEMLQYAYGLLEGQAAAMAALDQTAPAELMPHIEGARGCGMGAMRGMREDCPSIQQGPGGGGGNCPGQGPGGNGGHDGTGNDGNGNGF